MAQTLLLPSSHTGSSGGLLSWLKKTIKIPTALLEKESNTSWCFPRTGRKNQCDTMTIGCRSLFFRSSMASLPQHELAANTELSSFSDLQLGMTSAKKPSLQQIRAGLAKRPLLRRVCQWNTFQKLRPIIIRIFRARRTTMSMCIYIYIWYTSTYIQYTSLYYLCTSIYLMIFDHLWINLHLHLWNSWARRTRKANTNRSGHLVAAEPTYWAPKNHPK